MAGTALVIESSPYEALKILLHLRNVNPLANSALTIKILTKCKFRTAKRPALGHCVDMERLNECLGRQPRLGASGRDEIDVMDAS